MEAHAEEGGEGRLHGLIARARAAGCAGPDGNLRFTEIGANKVAKATT